jgi:chromosome segregation protein
MRLSHIKLCGFRGFRAPLHISFAEGFNIIDGRNGVGKSTVFDAIEFALTGTLSKYGDAKAEKESVDDYLWWRGDATGLQDRYVEVGFVDANGSISVRRNPLGLEDESHLRMVESRLCDLNLAPAASVTQLCSSTLIRDEQITNLSLDMGETDRYVLLRDALGASDADRWIKRAAGLVAACKRRAESADREVIQVNAELSAASRRLDEVRAGLASDQAISTAQENLSLFLGVKAAADQLGEPARKKIAQIRSEISELVSLRETWASYTEETARRAQLETTVAKAEQEALDAAHRLLNLPSAVEDGALSRATELSRAILSLVEIGRHLGLHDGTCPLCAKQQSAHDYSVGLEAAMERARALDEEAEEAMAQQRARAEVERAVLESEQRLVQIRAELQKIGETIHFFEARRVAAGLSQNAPLEDMVARINALRATVDSADNDLRIIDTLRLNAHLETAIRQEAAAKERLQKTQERFGRIRKAEAVAASLHDAARRAAGETLDRRLERVLPLMAELYRRLRPHPVWDNIEYSIRGDVRRFLKLQVGDGLNPQFMFSSGQRRATGLAFLISVNLSLAWSRWKSLLLDDPVQHIDDFRSIHLAELLAQLVAEGRQIICAVEDPALAEVLARRLPLRAVGQGKRITLGPDDTGALAVREERILHPLVQTALISGTHRATG